MLADELKETFLFESLTDEQIGWLVEHGSEDHRRAGEILYKEGDPAEHFWVLLDGEVQLSKVIQGQNVTLITGDEKGVYAGATRAFVRVAHEDSYPTTGRVLKDSRLFRIRGADFSTMMERYFPMAMHLLDGLFMGVSGIEALTREREKLVALGRLSAGLAHELNNPAAAARRAAGNLGEALSDLQKGLAGQIAGVLTRDQLRDLASLGAEASERARSARALDPLTAGDRENELADWLEDHGVDKGWELAPDLVAGGLDIAWAERIAGTVGPDALGASLHWVGSTLEAASLIGELEDATDRISRLVGAVKNYSYMDRAPQQDVDVHEGIESTLVMLGNELKNGIEVVRDYDRDLPRISAYGSELNQVWTNLIDNAVDAMHGRGRLTIRTAHEDDSILVEVGDEGPGIPPEVQARIFEPFFTTKDVGDGTGLGLDISYRIVVQHHGGSLEVQSEPGDTRFQVRLPVTASPA